MRIHTKERPYQCNQCEESPLGVGILKHISWYTQGRDRINAVNVMRLSHNMAVLKNILKQILEETLSMQLMWQGFHAECHSQIITEDKYWGQTLQMQPMLEYIQIIWHASSFAESFWSFVEDDYTWFRT